jgi:hypothetical protein
MADEVVPGLEAMALGAGSAEAAIAAGAPPPSAMSPMGGPPGAQQRINIPMEVVMKWTTVYPAYINSTLTVAEGRRLPRSKCDGCE